jgi:hypothetical protein
MIYRSEVRQHRTGGEKKPINYQQRKAENFPGRREKPKEKVSISSP